MRVLTQECDRCKHGARASGWAAAVCAARQTTAKPAGARKAGVRDAMAGKIMHLKNSGPAHRALRDPLGQHELGNRAPWRPNVEPAWALREGLKGKCTSLEAVCIGRTNVGYTLGTI